jgi:protein-arginine kinase activator protein McsA
MFERFTERARQMVVLAQDEARLLKYAELALSGEEKEGAIEAQDFEAAAHLRDRERRLTRIATELQRVRERDRSA